MDKEYTGMDKDAMCICGVVAAFTAALSANFAAKEASESGCDWLSAIVSSDADFARSRSSADVVASATSRSATS